MRRLLPLVLSLLLLAPAAAAACGPDTPATFDPGVPTWQQVNGFELGSRKATVAEGYKYLDALAAASPLRVREAGSLATSPRGRELKYLVVGGTGHEVGEVAARMRALRNAELGAEDADEIARTLPAIAWISSNVHGNEPSGFDASMRLLHELVARTDCFNERRLAETLSVFLPTQNPDGREANTRANANGFDMNRDWFARTQPETDGKLTKIRELPPVLYIDAHEQGGTAGFFPPNADPIHHEISSEALSHINDVYGPAMREAADAANFDYTNYTTYDLFFMGFGDTVPSTAFGAAGMTFEKGSSSPYREKTFEQYTTQHASLNALVLQKQRLVREWAAQWREAIRQGSAGELEPNVVVEPSNSVTFPVPEGEVHGYVLRADRHAGDVAKLVRRLQALDVRVYRLTSEFAMEGYHPYGPVGTRTETLPAGTYWIPSAQAQKHWIQAILGEDGYVPFAYFYDVSSWSNPLHMGLDGGVATRPATPPARLVAEDEPLGGAPAPGAFGWTFAGDSSQAHALAIALMRGGATVSRVPGTGAYAVARGIPDLDALARERGVPVSALEAAPARAVALRAPKVALFATATAALSQSARFARYALEEQLGLQTEVVDNTDLESGYLLTERPDALIVPDGTVPTGGLTPLALAQLRLYVQTGGRYVGYRNQGLTIARAAGLSQSLPAIAPADFQIPGASFAIELDPSNPVAWGLRDRSFVFNTGDPIVASGTGTGEVVGRYPTGGRFFQSGYAEGTSALAGTPAVLDEAVGTGHAVLFTFDPNFRAYNESGLTLLGNAILYPASAAVPIVRRAADLRPGLLRALARHGEGRDVVVRVRRADAAELRSIRSALALPRGTRLVQTLRGLTLRIPNPRAVDVHGRAYVPRLLGRLHRAGVEPTLLIL